MTPRTPYRRLALGLAAVLAGSMTLAACGSGSSSSGTPTLTWYINPDVGNLDASLGGQATIAQNCTEDAGGDYAIDVELLPNDASQQREQLVRRLAAGDSAIDLMSLDPAFTAEFANADFLAPVPSDVESTLTDGVLDGAIKAAEFDGKLIAAPFWSNTQVLWYRKSVVDKAGLDMSKAVTWSQIIEAAQQTGTTVQVQGKRYEGYAVWLNALITSAGGSIVTDTGAGRDATIDVDSDAGRQAAEVVQQLADSGAANAALSNTDEGLAQAGFTAADGGFMVNWEYIYADPASAEVKDDIGWAAYPRVDPAMRSTPPFGGINIGVSAFSDSPELGYDAAACITSAENEKLYAINSGNQASRASVYEDSEIKAKYPMAGLWKKSIDNAAPRPLTPYWTDISAALVASWHPQSAVDPESTPAASQQYISDVLEGKALL